MLKRDRCTRSIVPAFSYYTAFYQFTAFLKLLNKYVIYIYVEREREREREREKERDKSY